MFVAKHKCMSKMIVIYGLIHMNWIITIVSTTLVSIPYLSQRMTFQKYDRNTFNFFKNLSISALESGGTVPNPIFFPNLYQISLRLGSKSHPPSRRDGSGAGITVKKRDRDYRIPSKYFTRVKVRRSSIRWEVLVRCA